MNKSQSIDWEAVKKKIQDLITKGNEQENKKQYLCIPNSVQSPTKKHVEYEISSNLYLGPYVLTALRNNGTVMDC